jgi:hypothetical protein
MLETKFQAHTEPSYSFVQGDSNMTGTDLYVNKPQSVPVIFEPPCTFQFLRFLTADDKIKGSGLNGIKRYPNSISS